jgi:phytoene synthase
MESELIRFESLLAECYAGTPIVGDDEAAHALRAFSMTVDDCQIPMKPFLELAEGCRMDLTIKRYPDWPELERYCYHVAGVVGLIMCYVFDLRDTRAHQQAVAMGNAMQLTNILRDVGEDYDRGRIYLPQDEMLAFGVSERDIDEKRATRAFKELIRFQIARARAMYAEGCDGLCALPTDGSRQTACVMATVYGGILGAIERMDCDVFAGRAHLGTLGKLARIPAALKLTRLEFGDKLNGIF